MKLALREYEIVYERNLAIATRLPIVRSWTPKFVTPTHQWARFAGVEWNRKEVLIGNVHFTPVRWDYFLLSDWAGLPGHMGRAAKIRLRQAEELIGEVEGGSRGRPAIVCGDFNGPPVGTVYSMLQEGFRDTFSEAGFGCGYSIPSAWPVLRLDYVLIKTARNLDRQPAIASCRVTKSGASDHRPVLAAIGP